MGYRDHLGCPDPREYLVRLDSAGHRVSPASRALRDHPGQLVPLDLLVLLARMDRLDQPDLVDPLVHKETLDSPVNQGRMDLLDHWVLLGLLELQAN